MSYAIHVLRYNDGIDAGKDKYKSIRSNSPCMPPHVICGIYAYRNDIICMYTMICSTVQSML